MTAESSLETKTLAQTIADKIVSTKDGLVGWKVETFDEIVNVGLGAEELNRKSFEVSSPQLKEALQRAATNQVSSYLLKVQNEGGLDFATSWMDQLLPLIANVDNLGTLKDLLHN